LTIEEASASFLFHCRYEKNLSPRTLRAYTIDLSQFSAHLARLPGIATVQAVDKLALRGYIKQLFGGNAEKTVKRKVATLKVFFNYLEREDAIAVNPLRKMEVRIKETRRLPRAAPFFDIKAIFQHLYRLKETFRDRSSAKYRALVRDIAVLELLFATGARVSEVCNLAAADLDLRGGRVMILGKGAKERTIQLCDQETLAALRELMAYQSGNDRNACFFHNRLGRRFSDQSVRSMLRRRAAAAGVKANITPHMVRHSVATLLIAEGVDIRHIQHLLGHSSILTTQLYTQVDDRSHRHILAKRHPRRRFRVNQPPTEPRTRISSGRTSLAGGAS
jgi:integrase/recombinase XerD